MFKVPIYSFEDKSPNHLIAHSFYGNILTVKGNLRAFKRYLEEGGKVFIKIKTGARKGTIGRLDIKPEDIDTWTECKTGYGETLRTTIKEWRIVFDDRDNVIKVGFGSACTFKWPGDLITDYDGPTVFCYEKKEKPKAEPVKMYDHFGVPLEVGQTVLFMHGKGQVSNMENRIGTIQRISDKGTIWVETIITRKDHKKEVVSQGIYGTDMFVLDGTDLKSKALMARLAV